MTPTTWTESRLQCPRCGNSYLPPWREGAFLCSVCRARLPARPRRHAARQGSAGLLLLAALVGLVFLLVGARINRQGPERVARASGASLPTDQQWGEEDQQRYDDSGRASIRRELRSHPERSAPHARLAQDTFVTVRAEAESRVDPPPSFGGMEGGWQQGRRWELLLERYIATHLRDEVAAGVKQTETALRLARSAVEELDARRWHARGLLLLGEYRRALPEFAWLDAVEPGVDARPYVHCYEHLGLPPPDRLERALRMRFMPGPSWTPAENLGQIERALKATEQWARRWPGDNVLQMQLGALCFLLAGEQASRQKGFPDTARDTGEKIDAFVFRHQPGLVHEAVAHYQRAVGLATEPWPRARAMEELARGYVIDGRPEAAIAVLKRALALAPELPQAPYTLRAAFRRIARLRGPLRDTTGSDVFGTASGGGFAMSTGFSGVPRLSRLRRPPQSQATVREAHRLLQFIDAPEAATRDARRQRQDALNRLDEILRGCATGYEPATGDVLDVDERWVRRRMDQTLHQMDPAGGQFYAGPGGGSMPFPGGLAFRP